MLPVVLNLTPFFSWLIFVLCHLYFYELLSDEIIYIWVLNKLTVKAFCFYIFFLHILNEKLASFMKMPMSMHTHKQRLIYMHILDPITQWPHPLKIMEFLLSNIQHFQIMLDQEEGKAMWLFTNNQLLGKGELLLSVGTLKCVFSTTVKNKS